MIHQCSTCDHFGGIDCLRYPTPVPKSPSDTCGEWMNVNEIRDLQSKKVLLD